MVASLQATTKLPSFIEKSASDAIAWKKIALDIGFVHLREATHDGHSPASKQFGTSHLPSPDSVHLLDTYQLWQCLEFHNKANLPKAKRRLRRLVPRRRRKGARRPGPSHEKSDKRERQNPTETEGTSHGSDEKFTEEGDSDSDVSTAEEHATTSDGKTALPTQNGDGFSEVDGEMSELPRVDVKMAGRIRELEDNIVQPKPWALRGEVTASARPKDSLLASDFEFNTSRKPGISPDGDRNEAIEELIRSRVADNQFDDIIPRAEPPQTKGDNRKSTGADDWLSQKPVKGLGEEYEDVFKEGRKSNEQPSSSDNHPKGIRDKRYAEVYAAFDRVAQNLDALCRYSVTPMVSEVAVHPQEAVPEDPIRDPGD